jgi:glycosidase
MSFTSRFTISILGMSLFLVSGGTFAQGMEQKPNDPKTLCYRIDPPNWYNKMGRDTLQLLFYGNNLKNASVRVCTPGFVIGKNRSASSSYLLQDLVLNDSFTGTVVLEISQGRKKQLVNYEILPKPDLSPADKNARYTLSPSDAMYLIMPDRFKNGDYGNDAVSGMLEAPDKMDPFGRHGGDIKGIREGLSYIKEMGYTAIWCTPLWENNQPKQSYHGYACTDHYGIDPRFGSLEEYVSMSEEARKNGLKMVVDLVYNHTGHKHPLYENPVDTNWFHHYTAKSITNYRLATIPDPYALSGDRKRMEQGWFVKEMPDLNQSNPDVAQYLIQNTLWWLAKAKLAGIRVDTYPYSELAFLSELNDRLKRVFPSVFLFGETWEVGVATQAVYAPNIFSPDILGKPHSVTDFQVCFALQKGLKESWNWDGGLSRLYYTLAADYLYKKPEYLVTFIDNHDIDRIHGQYGKEIWKTKMSLGLLSMTRGIPCVFYGTEALMAKTGSHGDIREDMPGFNKEDGRSIFDSSERAAHEKEMISWIGTLNKIRTQTHTAFFNSGKRFQMVPTEGIYAAGIKGNTSVLLYAANQSDTLQELDMSTLAELNLDLSKAQLLVQSGNVNAREIERTGNYWKLGARDFYVWEIPVMEVLLKETSPR